METPQLMQIEVVVYDDNILSQLPSQIQTEVNLIGADEIIVDGCYSDFEVASDNYVQNDVVIETDMDADVVLAANVNIPQPQISQESEQIQTMSTNEIELETNCSHCNYLKISIHQKDKTIYDLKAKNTSLKINDTLTKHENEILKANIVALEHKIIGLETASVKSGQDSITLKLNCNNVESVLKLKDKKFEEVSKVMKEQRSEILSLTAKCMELSQKIEKCKFSVENFKSDIDIMFYTGLQSYERFSSIFNFLNPGENGESLIIYNTKSMKKNDQKHDLSLSKLNRRPQKLATKDQFYLVMIRLRLGLLEMDLSRRFEVSQSTISRLFITWISYMHHKLSEREQTMPSEHDAVIQERGVSDQVKRLALKLPQFLQKKNNSKSKEVAGNGYAEEMEEVSPKVAKLVEKRIQRVKRAFHIFDTPLTGEVWEMANQIWIVCSLLMRFQNNSIHENEIVITENVIMIT